jgi:hypothetical protein
MIDETSILDTLNDIVNRNVIVYETPCKEGEFTKKLVALAKQIMSRTAKTDIVWGPAPIDYDIGYRD